MSDTADTNRAIQALRERATEISSDIVLLAAQRDEVLRAIGIVERNGRKKPGPKVGGTRLATAELASVATDAEREP